MSNPFDPPTTSIVPGPAVGRGDFDLGRALNVGIAAVRRNGWVWLAVMLIGGFGAFFSLLACLVPALFVIPVLTWGNTRFTLETLDGDADLDTLFSGFSRAGEAWASMVGFGVFYLAASAPGLLVSGTLQYGPSLIMDTTELGVGAQLLLAGLSLGGSLFNQVWSVVVMSRFLPASFLIVEQGKAPLDAFTESWQLTSGVWGKSMALSLVCLVLPLFGMAVCCVGVFPAAMLVSAASASMYRQLIGRG